MSKEYYIRLTLGVYKVSQLFPKKEPLRADLTKVADQILASLFCDNHQGCSEDIKLIQKLINIAESRELADPRNFLVLRREYARVNELIGEAAGGIVKPTKSPSTNSKNKKRQEVILDILKNNGKIKMSDLAKSFPDINRRTILRDLGTFCQSGVVERNGSGRGACYNIKNATL
jgi:predicted transcriptional regulator